MAPLIPVLTRTARACARQTAAQVRGRTMPAGGHGEYWVENRSRTYAVAISVGHLVGEEPGSLLAWVDGYWWGEVAEGEWGWSERPVPLGWHRLTADGQLPPTAMREILDWLLQ